MYQKLSLTISKPKNKQMFTKVANRFAQTAIKRTSFLASNTLISQARFSTSKVLKQKSYLQAYLLGLAGVSIVGYSSMSIQTDEFYEKTIPADLQEGQKLEV